MDIYIGNINDYTTQYLTGLVCARHAKASGRYRFDADRRRTLLAHALLDHAVSVSLPDMPLPTDPTVDGYGKPHIFLDAEHEFHFSLSHSGDYSICAVGKSPVGADIEAIGNDKERIAERFFAKEEQGFIKDSESFYRIWTLKESFMKAVGLGMKLPMDSFTVTELDEETGSCRFKPCGSDSENTIADSLKDIYFDHKTGYYTISGMTLSKIPGYSLSVALCNTGSGEDDILAIPYPVL